MDRGAWRAIVHGVVKSGTQLEWLRIALHTPAKEIFHRHSGASLHAVISPMAFDSWPSKCRHSLPHAAAEHASHIPPILKEPQKPILLLHFLSKMWDQLEEGVYHWELFSIPCSFLSAMMVRDISGAPPSMEQNQKNLTGHKDGHMSSSLKTNKNVFLGAFQIQVFRSTYNCCFGLLIWTYHSTSTLVAQMVKNLLQCRRLRFDPWVRKFPGEGDGNPLQYSCLENSMDREAWQATVHGVTKNWTWLSSQHTQSFHILACKSQFLVHWLEQCLTLGSLYLPCSVKVLLLKALGIYN